MGKKTCYSGVIISTFGHLGTWLGFTVAGVKAGSIAAFIQGLIGNVASNSIFATLTSWGMRGLFPIFGNIGLIIFGYGLITSFFKKEKPKEEKSFYAKAKEKVFSFFSKPEKKKGFFSSLFNT